MNENGNLVSRVAVWNSDSEIGKMNQIEDAGNIKITVLADERSEEISVFCFHLHLDFSKNILCVVFNQARSFPPLSPDESGN